MSFKLPAQSGWKKKLSTSSLAFLYLHFPLRRIGIRATCFLSQASHHLHRVSPLSFCGGASLSSPSSPPFAVSPLRDSFLSPRRRFRHTRLSLAQASDAIPVTTEDPAPQTQNPKESFQHQDTNIQIKLKPNNVTSELSRESLTISEQTRDANVGALSTLKGNGATVQVLKKPGGAFGALLGNPASKRKLGLDKKVMLELW